MKIKESIIIILVAIINIGIAYLITTPLNITNTVLYQSYINNTTITYEVIIWLALSFIEAYIYEEKRA